MTASILTLRSAQQSTSAKEQLIHSLRDGQPVSNRGTAFEYTRSLSTMFLYSDKGLQLYADITKTAVSPVSLSAGFDPHVAFEQRLTKALSFAATTCRRITLSMQSEKY